MLYIVQVAGSQSSTHTRLCRLFNPLLFLKGNIGNNLNIAMRDARERKSPLGKGVTIEQDLLEPCGKCGKPTLPWGRVLIGGMLRSVCGSACNTAVLNDRVASWHSQSLLMAPLAGAAY